MYVIMLCGISNNEIYFIIIDNLLKTQFSSFKAGTVLQVNHRTF